MNISLAKLTPIQRGEIAIGNVYLAKGGKGPTKYWMVVQIADHRISVLGIDADGNITTAQNYLRHAIEGRQYVGHVQLNQLTLDIE